MRKVHHKSLLLLVIWCLIGSLPRWGMVGSWIWLGVLILLAILFGSRKKEIPALFFIDQQISGAVYFFNSLMIFQFTDGIFKHRRYTGIICHIVTQNAFPVKR